MIKDMIPIPHPIRNLPIFRIITNFAEHASSVPIITKKLLVIITGFLP